MMASVIQNNGGHKLRLEIINLAAQQIFRVYITKSWISRFYSWMEQIQ